MNAKKGATHKRNQNSFDQSSIKINQNTPTQTFTKFPEINKNNSFRTGITRKEDQLINIIKENKLKLLEEKSSTENSPYKKREKRSTLPNVNTFSTTKIEFGGLSILLQNNTLSRYCNNSNLSTSRQNIANSIIDSPIKNNNSTSRSNSNTNYSLPNKNSLLNMSPLTLKSDMSPLLKMQDGLLKFNGFVLTENNNRLEEKDLGYSKTKFNINTFSKSKAGNNGGKTKTNQDSCLVKLSGLKREGFNLFAVMDGHGSHGHFISNSVKAMFSDYIFKSTNYESSPSLKNIKKKIKENNYNLLKKCFQYCETSLAKSKYEVNFSGTTAVMVIQIDNVLICANTGDSRAILFTSNGIKELSLDHKPDNEEEKIRIEKSGGRVEKFNENGQGVGPYRVWLKYEDYPGLAMSRSLGDFVSKSVGCSCIPEVIETEIDTSCKFMIIASDGVWEFLNNQEVCKLVEPFYLKNDPEGACDKVIKESAKMWKIEDDGQDDITCVIVFFHSTE